MKKYYYVSILLGAFALSGCTEEKADSIPSNTESVGKVNIYEMKGFSEINEESLIVITDSEEINSIEEAIKGAEKVPGIVDVFEPHYQVNIGEKTYYLWIHNKHTNISSTNHGHGLCYYFFIVEVKESRPASGIILESVFKTG